MLDFLPGGTITVQGANTAGFLTITNGTFRISGSGTFSNPVFTVAAYTIPATGGFWLNDANATVAGQNGSPTNNGSLRVTARHAQRRHARHQCHGRRRRRAFTIEGGTVNLAGRLDLRQHGHHLHAVGRDGQRLHRPAAARRRPPSASPALPATS